MKREKLRDPLTLVGIRFADTRAKMDKPGPNNAFLQNGSWEMLKRIGRELDEGWFPAVKNCGVVIPGEFVVKPETAGEDIDYEQRQRKGRPSARSRKRAARRKRSPGRSGTPSKAAPVISTSLQETYGSQLDEIEVAYPGVQHWQEPDALWLLTTSRVLDGCTRNAVFVSVIPCKVMLIPRSWGFWNGCQWIGPRHTNFPDGSVCSYEPRDHTWHLGDSIVSLLDLHTLWALRHLHLEVFGRWPGPQAVPYAYERLLELREDEYCGCEAKHPKLYGECCRGKDLASDRLADAIHFTLRMAGGLRNPPTSVCKFVHGLISRPPSLSNLFI